MVAQKIDRIRLLKIAGSVCLLGFVFFLGTLANSRYPQVKNEDDQLLEKELDQLKGHSVNKRAVGRGSTGNNQDARTTTPQANGAVYIRWGRTTCTGEAQKIYKGTIAGGASGHTGGSSEYICITDTPNQDSFIAGSSAYSLLYGAEFKAHPDLFNLKNLQTFTNHDGNCIACLSIRNSMIMIPGQKECVPGWTMEYHGVLMSSKYTDKSNKNHICVDWAAEADPKGYKTEGGADMWPVESRCGSLPCPHYQEGKELVCVVCTR